MRVLRPYQREAKVEMSSALDQREKSGVLSLCPAGGKTFTAIDWLEERFLSKKKRILWIVHRDELAMGAAQTFIDHVPGLSVTTWFGDNKDSRGAVVILSNQSYQSWLNMLAKNPEENDFAVIVIDECHHATVESTYYKICQVMKFDFLLGLSGTPDAAAGKEAMIKKVLYAYSFTQAWTTGYCARPVVRRCRTKQSHLFQVKLGEFTNASLKALNNAPRNEYVARMFWDHRTPEGCACKGGKCPKTWWPGAFYASDVEHAWAIRAALIEEGKKREMTARFEVITGETDKGHRRQVVADFHKGLVDGIINCGVFTEGTDLPLIRSIQLCRPTASQRLWTQIVLRGGRSFPEFVVTGDEDPAKGLHPDNHFYLVDYVDSSHLAENISRQMAMKFLDKAQVKREIAATDDADLRKLMVEKAGVQAQIDAMVQGLFGAIENKEKASKEWKQRIVQYEDSGLEMEAFVLAGVSSVLIYSVYKDPEVTRLLGDVEDTAILLGREYINRLLTRDSEKDERTAAIKRSYDLFAKDCMKFKEWQGIIDAYISYSLYKTVKRDDGRRVFMYLSGVKAPPEKEIIDAIDEIEAVYAEADKKFDAKVLWAQFMIEAEKRWPSPMWRNIEPLCSNFTWREKIFGFSCSAGSTVKQVWWVEAAAHLLIKKLTEYDDAVAVVRINPKTNKTCPQCKKPIEMRMAGNGGRFLACTGFKSNGCKYTDKWMSRRDALDEMQLMLGHAAAVGQRR